MKFNWVGPEEESIEVEKPASKKDIFDLYLDNPNINIAKALRNKRVRFNTIKPCVYSLAVAVAGYITLVYTLLVFG